MVIIHPRVNALMSGERDWTQRDRHVQKIIMDMDESLPETLGNLKTLRYLCILGTGFEELPEVIKKLDGLQELDIEQVPLKNNRVPDWVMQLPSLTYLQMNETTEEELERLKKLGPNVDILAEGWAPT